MKIQRVSCIPTPHEARLIQPFKGVPVRTIRKFIPICNIRNFAVRWSCYRTRINDEREKTVIGEVGIAVRAVDVQIFRRRSLFWQRSGDNALRNDRFLIFTITFFQLVDLLPSNCTNICT